MTGNFPAEAVSRLSPEEIAKRLAKSNKQVKAFGRGLRDFEGLSLVGTGHSFMVPGYRNLKKITDINDLQYRSTVHFGPGVQGSLKYIWELENGIYQHSGRAEPRLLTALVNGKRDVMTWGPYIDDRVEYYYPWVDFARRYNPDIRFFMTNLWPRIGDVKRRIDSEDELTVAAIRTLAAKDIEYFGAIAEALNQKYGEIVHILPTATAVVMALEAYKQGDLAGIDGLHKMISGANACFWRDGTGHLCEAMEPLIGYVFYAGIYGRNPELLGDKAPGRNPELDLMLRRVAWAAVLAEPLSGVTDINGNGISDILED